MAEKPKMSALPPKSQLTPEEFLAGADSTPSRSEDSTNSQSKPKKKQTLPWEAPGVRADVKKGINLQLSEPLYLKLKFLSDHTDKSQQKIIKDALEPHIENLLKKLLS